MIRIVWTPTRIWFCTDRNAPGNVAGQAGVHNDTDQRPMFGHDR